MKRKYVVAFPFFATLIFILILSVTVLAQSAQSTAEKPTADSFGVEDASGQSGTYVEVPVNITNVRNGPVQSIRIRVDYNESVLSLTSISEGDLTLNWTHLQLGEDRHTMTIATSYTGDAIPDGSSGSVVLLNFHVLGSPGDKSPMNLSLIELSNPYGEVGRTAPAMNGTFTVIYPGTDITPPKIIITSPKNGSTLGILNNSVIGSITDESDLASAYLTLNGNPVTNLTKGLFNVKVNYAPNETNEIEVFAKDIAGNANSSQVLVNVLPNVVVVNTSAVANQTIEITGTKNATNTVIELNATKAANVSVTINVNTNASALNVTPATNTSIYGVAQKNLRSFGKYIDVKVTGIDRTNLTFVSLKHYYTAADLDRTGDGDADDPGDLNEQTLKIYWFNPNTSLWMPLGPGPDAGKKPDYTDLGGPKVIDDERNMVEKYIKVTLNHFSTFAIVGEVIPAHATPTPTLTPTPSNVGGGGGGGYVPTTPTPTEKPPVVVKVVKIISRIEAGKPESVTFEGLDVYKISIEADKNVNDVNVMVEELEKPKEIAEALGTVYAYYNITATNLTDVNVTTTIEFKVSKSWMADENIEEATIRLCRYDEGWKALPTSKIDEDDAYVYFSAETHGFSIFAISGTKKEEAAVTPALTTPATPAATITPPATAPTPISAPTTPTPALAPGLTPLFLFLILIVTAVIVIAGITIIVLRRK